MVLPASFWMTMALSNREELSVVFFTDLLAMDCTRSSLGVALALDDFLWGDLAAEVAFFVLAGDCFGFLAI